MPDTPVGDGTSNYALTSADLGASIYCKVTATNASGTANADSNTVGPVAAAAGTSSAWNPADRTADVPGEALLEFSNSDRTATVRFLAGSSHHMSVRGALSHSSGKRYFEIKLNLIPYTGYVGMASSSLTMTDTELALPGASNSLGIICLTDHDLLIPNFFHSTGTEYDVNPDIVIATNSVIGFAVDFDTRTAYIRHNSTWAGVGTPADPVAGTGGLAWGATPTSLYPWCKMTAGGADPDGIFTIATQDAHFLNPPPTGYTAWG